MLAPCYEPCYVPTYLYFCWIKTFVIFSWFPIQNSQFEINFVSKISLVDAFLYRILFLYIWRYQKFIFCTEYTATPHKIQINGLWPSRTANLWFQWNLSYQVIDTDSSRNVLGIWTRCFKGPVRYLNIMPLRDKTVLSINLKSFVLERVLTIISDFTENLRFTVNWRY